MSQLGTVVPVDACDDSDDDVAELIAWSSPLLGDILLQQVQDVRMSPLQRARLRELVESAGSLDDVVSIVAQRRVWGDVKFRLRPCSVRAVLRQAGLEVARSGRVISVPVPSVAQGLVDGLIPRTKVLLSGVWRNGNVVRQYATQRTTWNRPLPDASIAARGAVASYVERGATVRMLPDDSSGVRAAVVTPASSATHGDEGFIVVLWSAHALTQVTHRSLMRLQDEGDAVPTVAHVPMCAALIEWRSGFQSDLDAAHAIILAEVASSKRGYYLRQKNHCRS